jgi:hypothetical protein
MRHWTRAGKPRRDPPASPAARRAAARRAAAAAPSRGADRRADRRGGPGGRGPDARRRRGRAVEESEDEGVRGGESDSDSIARWQLPDGGFGGNFSVPGLRRRGGGGGGGGGDDREPAYGGDADEEGDSALVRCNIMPYVIQFVLQ